MDHNKIFEKWAGVFGTQSGNPEMESGDFKSDLLPMAMRVASRTVGFDLVSVQPMDYGMTEEERNRIESEIKEENRDGKIDSIVEGKEFVEKKVEDHPDYRPGPGAQLMYLDFKYDNWKDSENDKTSD